MDKLNFNFSIRHEVENEATAEMHVVNIDGKRIGIVAYCYHDDDGTQIIDIREKIEGYSPRQIAFIADGMPTQIYPLSGMAESKKESEVA
jgi:hypothetical protein